jgi:hypothetical protein
MYHPFTTQIVICICCLELCYIDGFVLTQKSSDKMLLPYAVAYFLWANIVVFMKLFSWTESFNNVLQAAESSYSFPY